MDLSTVCKKGVAYKTRKRVGRGTGSGHGKTCGRGHKGQGQRSGYSRSPGFEGGQMPIYRRMPKRGFTNARFRTDFTIVNVSDFDAFSDGDTVDLEAILSKGLASLNTPYLKVLGNGDCSRKVTVRAQKFSKSAQEKIEAAGGSVEVLEMKARPKAAE